MSVGTITIQLPSRACWWIKHLSLTQGIQTRDWITQAVLRELAHTPGVDLSRSPELHTKGARDGENR